MTVSCSVLYKRSSGEVVGPGVTVLTFTFGSFCPGKESEANTPYKTAGNDFATDSATNFSRSECLPPLPAIWIGSDAEKVSA